MHDLVTLSLNLPPAVADNLHAWGRAARHGLSENTQRAYTTDSHAFADWCRTAGLPMLPATPETVATYLRSESAAGKAVATIRRRAATITRLHRAAGLANPCEHELVWA